MKGMILFSALAAMFSAEMYDSHFRRRSQMFLPDEMPTDAPGTDPDREPKNDNKYGFTPSELEHYRGLDKRERREFLKART